MKKLIFLATILSVIVFLSSTSHAQVTNLTVNNASPGQHFTLESGGEINWNLVVPNPGDTALFEIWLDLDSNGVINPGIDKIWQQINQIDGDTLGDNGPPDMDGIADSKISLTKFLIGLAPADYIIKATNNGSGEMVSGTVTPLTDVAYTISGKVTVSAGEDPSNIVVELNRNEKYMPFFWDALTDAQGNFTIKMTADTSSNTWELRISDGQFPGYIITPQNYEVTVDGNKNNLNFTINAADAVVTGLLKDENGAPIPFTHVTLFYLLNNNTETFNYDVDTDVNGNFSFGIPENRLTGQEWILQAGRGHSDTTENFMDTRITLNPINVGDSVYKSLTLYAADTTITGTVSFEGNNSNVPKILLIAHTDSTEAYVHNDTISGNYTLRVSSKIGSYRIFGTNLPWGYDTITIQNVQPGATNVNLNFLLTDVKSDNEIIPKIFKLGQNFPNPFNPSTVIKFSIPTRQFVSLNIYNILGQKMAKVINKEMNAGNYKINFNAENLPSGLYIYRLTAGKFVAAKKMMLLK